MKTKNIFYLCMGLMAMSGFYSDIMYGLGSVQTSVAWQGMAKRGEAINIGDHSALNGYLNGIHHDSSIVISLADMHGYHNYYNEFIEQVKVIKNKGFSKVYVVIDGDLAPRRLLCMGEENPKSLEYACKNFLLPLSGLCKIIFNLGNHELQNVVSFYKLLLFLKTNNIPFLTHIPEGIDWDKLVEEYNDFDCEPTITFANVAELLTNILPYKIIENTLFFPYCSSFLVYGGGVLCSFLSDAYRCALQELCNNRFYRDNLPSSADGNLITRTTKEYFQRAITDLAKIHGPINIVIAAHEFYDPSDNTRDRVRGIFELILRDITISGEVLNRLTWTIVCGHEHLKYHHKDQSLTVGGKLVQYDVIGTTVHAVKTPNFAIMAFKPQPLLPVGSATPLRPAEPAKPAGSAAYKKPYGHYSAMPDGSRHAEGKNHLLERPGTWKPVSVKPILREVKSTLPVGRPTLPAVKPTLPARRPTLPAGRPTLPAVKPTWPAGRPTLPARRPTLPAVKPTWPARRPVLLAGRSTLPAVKPTWPARRPTLPARRPTLPAVKPTWPARRPTLPAVKPTWPARRPTLPAVKPTWPARRPTLPAGRPTLPARRPNF
ncbi:MAG: hypothetical protein LBD60_00730 [Puniceicoccales bacterium]|jgi:hypothetical protein|nr:hypothetical protein [Puniceicoccales bacterium]